MRQRESHDLSGLLIDAQKCFRIPSVSSKIENFKKYSVITWFYYNSFITQIR